MKCKSCDCQVSAEFKHAIETNCCPKCGKTIMDTNVQGLLIKMNEVLRTNNNDIGALAVWFSNTYLSDSEDADRREDTSTADDQGEIVEDIQEERKPSKKTPPRKIQRSTAASKEQSSEMAERAALITKRAGIDKSKYERLVRDIQEESFSALNSSDVMLDAGEDSDSDMDINTTPLSSNDIRSIEGLFDEPEKPITFNEIQRLQKIEQLATTGAVGKIRRSAT